MNKLLLLILLLLPLSAVAEENVAPPASCPVRTMNANVTSISYNFTMDTPVDVALSGQDVYIRGLCLTYPEYWIKGRMDAEGFITFPQRQFLFQNEGIDDYTEEEYSYPIYAYGVTPNGKYCDFVMYYDYDTDTYTSDAGTYLSEVADFGGSLYPGDYYSAITITASSPADEGGEPVLLPDGAEVRPYKMTAMEWTQGEITYDAGIALVGDEAYLTDFCVMAQDSGHCIKGYKQGNSLVFPAEQYLNSYEDEQMPLTHFFVYGADYNGATLATSDFILFYDPATDTYTANSGLMVSMGRITSSTVSFPEFLTGITLQGEGIEGITPQLSTVNSQLPTAYDLQGRTLRSGALSGSSKSRPALFIVGGKLHLQQR